MSTNDTVQSLKKHDALLRSNNLAMLSTVRARDGLISTNPVVAFCLVEPSNPTQYLEVRGHATLEDDPDRSFSRLQFVTGSGGQEPPAEMDPPEAERAIIVIHPLQVSSPTLYGGRFDRK